MGMFSAASATVTSALNTVESVCTIVDRTLVAADDASRVLVSYTNAWAKGSTHANKLNAGRAIYNAETQFRKDLSKDLREHREWLASHQHNQQDWDDAGKILEAIKAQL